MTSATRIELLPEPKTATAADHPCELYRYHAPAVVRTQGHHRNPMYLQVRVYGRVVDNVIMWLCGSCHDAVHDWISWRLGEARIPNPEPGRLAKAEAERTLAWYWSILGTTL